MPDLLPAITEAQVKASTWYQELEQIRAQVARTLAEERLGIYQTMPLEAAPDTVEVLTDVAGNILERMQFPFVMWTRRGGNLKQIEIHSLEEYWLWNENSGYPILFGKGAKLKHFSKAEGNPLQLAEWMFLRSQAGPFRGNILDAPFEALQIDPTIAVDRTPNAEPIDPAAVSVGIGRDVATNGAGIGAVDVGGTVTTYEQNARGDMVYIENIVLNKVCTLEAADPLKKPIVGQIYITAGATLKDFRTSWDSICIWVNSVANVLIDGCIAEATWNGDTGFKIEGGATHTINNSIAAGCNRGFWLGTNTTETTFNNSLGIHCDEYTFYNQSNSATEGLLYNCVAYQTHANDFVNAWGGDYNATTEPSGAPGPNSVHGLTQATARLACWFSPPTGTNLKPWDFRNMDGGASALENAGTPRAGVTRDIDGNIRDETNPNIGPSEGFLGFVEPAPTPELPLAATVEQTREITATVEIS